MQPTRRYFLIDALRGFSLLSMIAYHFCYDLSEVFGLPLSFMGTQGAFWWQQSICWAFILCSGASVRLGRNPIKRGLIVLGCGMLLTAVTVAFMSSQRIVFGVLHLMGSAMLLTALLSRFLSSVHPTAGAVGSFALFLATRWLSSGELFGVRIFNPLDLPTNLFAPLGVFGRGFFSADYFPIIPWFFLFLTGYFLFGIVCRYKLEDVLTKRVPLLCALGRHTLPIYLLHQPVLMGAAWLIWRKMG